jgi:hypothetical protein
LCPLQLHNDCIQDGVERLHCVDMRFVSSSSLPEK